MSAGIAHKIRVDEHLESYRTFFDTAWAQAIGEVVAGTKLKTPTFNLRLNWKAAANTCVGPWLICTSVTGFLSSFLTGRAPFGDQMIDACTKRLPEEMHDLSDKGREKLSRAIRKIGTEIRQAQEMVLDANRVWEIVLNGAASRDFGLNIWGSQRISYGAIFHAYENFIREAIGLALKIPHYKAGTISVLRTDCERAFGKPIADLCLADTDVDAARLVRNALAHNGGQETEQLRGVAHGIVIEGGELQIMAPDTRRLFDLLKVRALALAKIAVTHPSIR